MQLLKWEGKHGERYWMADTEKRLKAAFMAMFVELNDYGMYEGGEDAEKGLLEKIKKATELVSEFTKSGKVPDHMSKHEVDVTARSLKRLEYELVAVRRTQTLLKKARRGDAEAAEEIVESRKDWEYEGYELIDAEDPLKKRR